MIRKVFFTLLALVLAVSVGLVACGGTGEQEEEEEEEEEEEQVGEQEEEEEEEIETWQPGVHGEVTFSQLEWMKSPREVLYPYSNVGKAEFSFLEGAGDWLLAEHDGGCLNVVLVTQSGVYEWVIQNLYLTFDDMDYLLGSTRSVQFSLGLDNDTPIDELEAAVFLSDEPLEAQPDVDELSTYLVNHTPYLVGWMGDEEGGDSDIPSTIGPWIGPVAEAIRTMDRYVLYGEDIYPCLYPEIDVGDEACAPAAAARSISRLLCFYRSETVDPQYLYDQLRVSMELDKWHDEPWIWHYFPAVDFICCNFYGVIIESAWQMGDELNYQKHQDLMGMRYQVDVYIAWNGGKTHIANVASITTHSDGSATIIYVDDPSQGDEKAENELTVIAVDKDGHFNQGTVGFLFYEHYINVCG